MTVIKFNLSTYVRLARKTREKQNHIHRHKKKLNRRNSKHSTIII